MDCNLLDTTTSVSNPNPKVQYELSAESVRPLVWESDWSRQLIVVFTRPPGFIVDSAPRFIKLNRLDNGITAIMVASSINTQLPPPLLIITIVN